jgi:hypothetical protein
MDRSNVSPETSEADAGADALWNGEADFFDPGDGSEEPLYWAPPASRDLG